ncbi:hypothetical protein CEP88_19310 [Roseobacter denitrificans]|uniref:Lipoprotein, putative n=1 Tax=Roseobacter denitrificans (strain ATCC 33942 / OCh 114) TaxID=375451 RepID=Q168R9_ROSDO|nr:hypothetical protein [Roseobacter denitrificans]ABG31524.1 lipoprotein, putative [Roseobacter denitrificans OCh 114]AVL54523.1 hypothetical protein CEP88_19310 [Roseobacter denitrificans]SFF90378.1 hypothetical protein SAMN05443635_103309 [Roseobacter denitrificans OCh 114]
MTDDSKVLTVSYGTFSCTLEGFDDALDAMKDIAEYFRDLAERDRFFGAEPLQADAEVLARVARQNKAKPFEAAQADGKITLNAHQTVHGAAPTPEHAAARHAQTALDSAAAFFAKSATPSAITQDDMEEEMTAQAFAAVAFRAGVAPPPGAPLATATPVAGSTMRSTDDLAEKKERLRAAVARQKTHAQDEPCHQERAGDKTRALRSRAAGDASSIVVNAAHDIEEALQADVDHVDGSVQSQGEEHGADDIDAVLRALEKNGNAPDHGLAAGRTDEVAQQNGGESDVDAALDNGLPKPITDGSPDEPEAALSQGAPADGPPPASGAKRKEISQIKQSADDDLSRLMAEADHQMKHPDGQTRRRAFSQLRAAVAARRDDQSLDHDAVIRAKDVQAYRSDLADVVHPRDAGSPRARSTGGRTVPLKLAAELRVDAPGVTPKAQQSEITGWAADTGFAAYAQRLGAQSLPELLEAAAAYVSLIEGKAQFTRPQLMSLIEQTARRKLNQEEGLRCFGQLLRAGKIKKLTGGWFTISDGIGFTPDRRVTAQG